MRQYETFLLEYNYLTEIGLSTIKPDMLFRNMVTFVIILCLTRNHFLSGISIAMLVFAMGEAQILSKYDFCPEKHIMYFLEFGIC